VSLVLFVLGLRHLAAARTGAYFSTAPFIGAAFALPLFGERAKRKRPDNLDAYDLYLHALPHVRVHMPSEADKALALLRQALSIQPDYPAAHAAAALCYEQRYMRGGLQKADKEAALLHARAAIEAGADDAETLVNAGFAIGLVASR
jgi:tetratricopeptide (TPR) repeat protein